MSKKIWLTLTVIFTFLALLILTFILTLSNKHQEIDKSKYVMHASGGLNKQIYLNSKESLENYINQGFRLFEVDFAYTSDKQIVCTHKFENIPNYDGSTKPTFEEFNSHLVGGKFHPLDLNFLITTFNKHPDAKLIFDTKEPNAITIFEDLYIKLKSFKFKVEEQLIAQVYSKDGFHFLKDFKVKEFWFSNYMAKYPQQTIKSYFENEPLVTTIVLDQTFFETFSSQGLKLNKKIAVHSYKSILTIKNSKKLKCDYIFVHY